MFPPMEAVRTGILGTQDLSSLLDIRSTVKKEDIGEHLGRDKLLHLLLKDSSNVWCILLSSRYHVRCAVMDGDDSWWHIPT